MRAKDQNQYVRVTYHAPEDEGNQYCDILHASEIAVGREWLDRVLRVEVLTNPPENLTTQEGREYLELLTKDNLPRIQERIRSTSFK